MFGTRSQGKMYNFVHTDEIWKDHVIRELQSQKKWSDHWGYLFEEYQKLQENLLNIGSELEEELETKISQELEQTLQFGQKLDDEYEGHPLVQTAPLTDCTVKNELTNQMFRLQENAKGKLDILKLLKWPREGMM